MWETIVESWHGNEGVESFYGELACEASTQRAGVESFLPMEGGNQSRRTDCLAHGVVVSQYLLCRIGDPTQQISAKLSPCMAPTMLKLKRWGRRELTVFRKVWCLPACPCLTWGLVFIHGCPTTRTMIGEGPPYPAHQGILIEVAYWHIVLRLISTLGNRDGIPCLAFQLLQVKQRVVPSLY